MNNSIFASLRMRILLIFGALSLGILILMVVYVAQTNQKFLHEVEQSKASLLAQTIAPDLSIALYMNLTDNAVEKINQLTMRDEVLKIVLTDAQGERIYESKKTVAPHLLGSAFHVHETLYAPAKYAILGEVTLFYSGHLYQQHLEQSNRFIGFLALTIALMLLLLGFMIGKMLQPLRVIATQLHHYKAGDFQTSDYLGRHDDIGVIAAALLQMDGKILEHRQQQQDIQSMLEEKVKQQTQTLHHRLYFDLLTDLSNRTSLISDLKEMDRATLMLINIVGFKQINDLFGIPAGDSLLMQFAELVRKFSETKMVQCYSFPADEFALLSRDMSLQRMAQTADELLLAINRATFQWEGHSFGLDVTIGAASDSSKGLIEKADIALKRAKREKKPFLFYTEAISVEREYYKNLAMARKIRYAIEHDTFVPFFQPIAVDDKNPITKFEALIRMRDEEGSILSPFVFLEIAQRMRLYHKLTELMIEKCCRYFSQIDAEFSINLTYEDINRPQTLSMIQRCIRQYGIGERIVFEILESEGIENYAVVKEFVESVKKLGCKIAIDDFGTGYSSLEHILHLDVDYLKIDASLIKHLDHDEVARRIVANIVTLAQSMQIRTIAEFVHSEGVCREAKRIGVDFVQGYYISEPLPDIHHLLPSPQRASNVTSKRSETVSVS